ncbi:hypothetical protein HPB51_000217 [Rhipicephalus microplus]|uniref:Uncharacterized protein n=1 Tax=Rhipicephalus microplus TaxID=6941 RepID=A0A9J6EKM7_RHIMP|nr:hypothetical protein HPB51_000217 [Rhipicephalus microplus]
MSWYCGHCKDKYDGALNMICCDQCLEWYHWANRYANGWQVRGYHVVNVALHCACSVLVAVVARRVMRIAALHACMAAMMFAAHPVHTEAVSSIVGRAEALCCLFFLLSFLCYQRLVCKYYIRDIVYRCTTDCELVTLATLTTLLLCFRLWILQGSFPEFSEMDNPASFSSMRTTRSGIRDVPENAKMHYNYANLQKDTGNIDVAVKHYKLAIDKQGQKDVARALLERAVELDPDFCEAYSSLAALAADRGGLAEAERLHQMALGSDGRNADARNNYGTFLQSHGRTKEAMVQYEQALNIQQNHTVTLLNAAKSLPSMNLNNQAENLYKKALAVEPDPRVMHNLAVFYVSAGRLDEARQLFENIDRRFPENRESKVHYALNYILRALKLCDVDDPLCAKIHSDHGDILKDLGDLSTSAQSDYQGAFLHYQVALSLDPKNKLITDNMAKLRRRLTKHLPFHDCV